MDSSFGPSDQQRASDECVSRHMAEDSALFRSQISSMSREELVLVIEQERAKNDKLCQEIKELREEKVRLSLTLEEEDERRANMFLKKVEELETHQCPKCGTAPAKPAANFLRPLSRSPSRTPIPTEPLAEEQQE